MLSQKEMVEPGSFTFRTQYSYPRRFLFHHRQQQNINPGDPPKYHIEGLPKESLVMHFSPEYHSVRPTQVLPSAVWTHSITNSGGGIVCEVSVST